MSPYQKLAAGRMKAIDKRPYFASAVMALVPREMEGLGTFGVTKGWVLLYDPAQAEEWTVDQIAEVLIHEVGHVLRDHHGRYAMFGLDPRLGNIAGDAEINDDLNAGALPGCPVLPSSFGAKDGLTMEEYYDYLRQHAQAVPQPGDGSGGGGADGGELGEEPGPGWCGSGAGRPLPGEPDDGAGGRSEADQQRVRQAVAADIKRAADKNRGTVPGGWLVWADQQLAPPQVPWPAKLRRAVRRGVRWTSGSADYHYGRPSRRQSALGTGPGKPILPATRSPVPSVVVAVDTSGSMLGEALSAAMAEVAGVLAAVGVGAVIVACDAEVHAIGTARTWREVLPLLKGGGGTDFRPVFEALEARRPKPDLCVFLTDGFGPAPEVPPSFRTIWVLIDGRPPCDWGEQVSISTKKA